MRRRTWLWLVAGGLIVAIAGVRLTRAADDRRLLETTLGMRPLPRRVQALECHPYGVTDVLATCALTIHPADFPALLRGRTFEEVPCDGRDSWTFTGGPRVGPRFPLSACFSAEPPEFEHGGFVRVATDAGRTRVITNLYIE